MSLAKKMIITITRSGGVAGTRTTATVDTDSLDPDRAKSIMAIVAQTRAASDRRTMMPDAFQYDVTITDDEGSKSMRFHGDPCPAAELFAAIRQV